MKAHEIKLTAANDETIALLCFSLAGMGLVLFLLWAQLVTAGVLISLPVLGGCTLFSLSNLRQRQPEYMLTEQGIHFGPHLGHPPIRWREVTAITTVTPGDSLPYVQLQLAADAAAWTTLSPLRKRLLRVYAGSPESIPVAYLYTAGLTLSHAQVVEILQRYWQQQKEAA